MFHSNDRTVLPVSHTHVYRVLLVVGLIGNSLVVFVVVRNKSMRTPTNIFLVNLALSDILVLIFCLPPTVLWDVTSTWWLGTNVCKALMFLQVRERVFIVLCVKDALRFQTIMKHSIA
jgi:hypothetical protein